MSDTSQMLGCSQMEMDLDRERDFLRVCSEFIGLLRKNWSKCPHLQAYDEKMDVVRALPESSSVRREGMAKVTSSLVRRAEPFKSDIYRGDLGFLALLSTEPMVQETTLLKKWRAVATASKFAGLRGRIAAAFRSIYAAAWACVHNRPASEAFEDADDTRATQSSDSHQSFTPSAACKQTMSHEDPTEVERNMTGAFVCACFRLVKAMGLGYKPTPEVVEWELRLGHMIRSFDTSKPDALPERAEYQQAAIQMQNEFTVHVLGYGRHVWEGNVGAFARYSQEWPLFRALKMSNRHRTCSSKAAANKDCATVVAKLEAVVRAMTALSQWTRFFKLLPSNVRKRIASASSEVQSAGPQNVDATRQVMEAMAVDLQQAVQTTDKEALGAAMRLSGLSTLKPESLLAMGQDPVFASLLEYDADLANCVEQTELNEQTEQPQQTEQLQSSVPLSLACSDPKVPETS